MTAGDMRENGELKQLVITAKCDRCNGFGTVNTRDECPNCLGSGTIEKIVECYEYYELGRI